MLEDMGALVLGGAGGRGRWWIFGGAPAQQKPPHIAYILLLTISI